jgi:flagellar protein FlgJ
VANTNIHAGLATSSTALDGLRATAARDPKAAIRETAKQFETLFMNELMKSMRATTQGSGWLENNGTEMATGMLDTQYATQLSGQRGGLADMIAKQLERQLGIAATGTPAAPGAGQGGLPGLPAKADASARQTSAAPAAQPRAPQQADARQFVRTHADAARTASAETGIPAAFILAQAAHESGWGRKEISHADGSTTHNVFGIKATPGWQGATAEVTTTEYVNGQPRKVTEKFRAYASYDEAFGDWARMLKQSPRYAQVVAQAAAGAGSEQADARNFAQGLQRAGYATDPQYAEKLGRVINTTLRLQRPSNA